MKVSELRFKRTLKMVAASKVFPRGKSSCFLLFRFILGKFSSGPNSDTNELTDAIIFSGEFKMSAGSERNSSDGSAFNCNARLKG